MSLANPANRPEQMPLTFTDLPQRPSRQDLLELSAEDIGSGAQPADFARARALLEHKRRRSLKRQWRMARSSVRPHPARA